jgi:hypothetical protein
MSQRFRKWPIIFGLWLVAGILFAVQSYFYRTSIGQSVSWSDILLYDASYFVLWFFFTPWLLWVGRRFYVDRAHGPGRIAAHVVIGIVTAYDEFALRAFAAHALDYLLKPVKAEAFRFALQRARALLQANHGKKHLLRAKIGELEAQLHPGQFVRIHRILLLFLATFD